MRKWMFAALLTVFACGIVPLPEQVPSQVPTTDAIIGTSSACQYVVGVDNLNLRDGNGTEYQVILVLKGGEEVTVVQDMGDGWTRVRVTRHVVTYDGYVNNEYLKGCEE